MVNKKNTPEQGDAVKKGNNGLPLLKKKLSLFNLLSIIIIIAAIGVCLYFYVQYQKAQDSLKSQAPQTITQAQALIAKVGLLMELPKNEEPQIATVTDITKLKNQSFFTNAKDGDKVLIYTKSQLAVLYDPYANKIVTVGPISIGPKRVTPASPGAPFGVTPTPKPLRIAIYNGTTIPGLAKTIQSEIKLKMSYLTVTETANAAKTSYPQTMVIDITGNNLGEADQLASLLNASISNLPKGEINPTSADLLIILGKK